MACAVDRIQVHRAGHLGDLGSVLDVGRDRSVREVLKKRPSSRRGDPSDRARRRRRSAPDRAAGRCRRQRSARRLGTVAGPSRLGRAAGPVHDDEAQSVAVPVLRDERQRRGDLESREAAELLRRLADEFIEHAKDGGGVVQVVEDRPGEDLVDLVSRYSSEVTTPKLPPPPRSPRRGPRSRVSLAVRNLPSAVTTSAEIRLSIDSPSARSR